MVSQIDIYLIIREFYSFLAGVLIGQNQQAIFYTFYILETCIEKAQSSQNGKSGYSLLLIIGRHRRFYILDNLTYIQDIRRAMIPFSIGNVLDF
ncbi:hypothetical protein GCM10025882_24230 [Acinetobacter gyllenbergii]|uniref:Uncharacterized protein n=1 Tax=Acinetobacter gyllenbergii CIP 110306 = MTCC 11365 TaxID=1217657 RepID=A0A829HC87_9GAMM|nr:hypothetical protein F957_03644 [Acinetobacter gyllenbergii CIP 110306 = MTCC 11365]GMA11998.1 hypothetical protein GCM10025882_24230 [Acinetobacter gyllenbergii]